MIVANNRSFIGRNAASIAAVIIFAKSVGIVHGRTDTETGIAGSTGIRADAVCGRGPEAATAAVDATVAETVPSVPTLFGPFSFRALDATMPAHDF